MAEVFVLDTDTANSLVSTACSGLFLRGCRLGMADPMSAIYMYRSSTGPIGRKACGFCARYLKRGKW